MRNGGDPSLPKGSAKLTALQRNLELAGIAVETGADGVSFSYSEAPAGSPVLTLPEPMAHPWRSTSLLGEIPSNPDSPQWSEILRAVRRLEGLLESNAPETLLASSRSILREKINRYYDNRIEHSDLICRGKLYFSGRSVIVPGADLEPHQVGIPEEMAWVLFEPYVTAEVGAEAVRNRTAEAVEALRSAVSSRWVRVNRAPTLTETAIIAFEGVVVPHRAIELHPMYCRWMNADFDGDQVAVMLPLTAEGQREAKEKLSVVGHLKRKPDLIRTLIPSHESLWGLARLSLTEKGKKQLEDSLGTLPEMPDGYLTSSILADAAAAMIARFGPEKSVETLAALLDLGLAEAERIGGSLNPFMQPPKLSTKDGDLQRAEVTEAFSASRDFDDLEFGTQLLMAKSGARGAIENLVMLCHSRLLPAEESALRPDTEGGAERGRTSSGQLDGLSANELLDASLDTRRHIAALIENIRNSGSSMQSEKQPAGYGVLARAVRAERPGVVFASAAESQEIDPLTDVDARLFAGLEPLE
jgi:hypothetical protein